MNSGRHPYPGPAMTYEIVKCRPELRTQLLELQTHLWGPDPALKAAYLDWKYLRNPYIEAPYIHLALHQGRAVAMHGGFGGPWQVGDPPQRLNWINGADAVIAPEHRGGGLHEKLHRVALADMAADGYTHTLTLSAVPISFWACVKLGWRCPGTFRPLRRGTWRAHRARLGRRIARRVPVLAGLWRRGWVASPDPSNDVFAALDAAGGQDGNIGSDPMSVDRSARPEAMAGLVGRLPPDGRIRGIRDEAFFAWRFADPFRVFRFLYWDDGGLDGYLILSARLGARGAADITILDWEATDARIKTALLSAAIDRGRFGRITVWSATLDEEDLSSLQTSGFKFVPSGLRDRTGRPEPNWPGILIRPTRDQPVADDWTQGGRDILDLSNWDPRQSHAG